LPPEDQARADWYALLARLLLRAPDHALLARLAAAPPATTTNPLMQAWCALCSASGRLDQPTVQREFDALFISASLPAVNPYASLYLSGFMHEKPLAALREALAQLNLGRVQTSTELEDHLGALCESMRVMIAGVDGVREPIPLDSQRIFFDTHIGAWYQRCLTDIRNAAGSDYYGHVADLAEAFFTIEAEAFEDDDSCNWFGATDSAADASAE
jgi:TorA maturation chaperone TorD